MAARKPKLLPTDTHEVENDHARRRLALLLAEATGFTFAVATYDTPATRAAQLARLAADLTDLPVALTTLDLSSSPGERFLLDRLRSHLAGVTVPTGNAGKRLSRCSTPSSTPTGKCCARNSLR